MKRGSVRSSGIHIQFTIAANAPASCKECSARHVANFSNNEEPAAFGWIALTSPDLIIRKTCACRYYAWSWPHSLRILVLVFVFKLRTVQFHERVCNAVLTPVHCKFVLPVHQLRYYLSKDSCNRRILCIRNLWSQHPYQQSYSCPWELVRLKAFQCFGHPNHVWVFSSVFSVMHFVWPIKSYDHF